MTARSDLVSDLVALFTGGDNSGTDAATGIANAVADYHEADPPTTMDHGALSGLGDNDHPQYALVAESAWSALAYGTGWQAYGGVGWTPGGYYKANNGVVHLQGMVERTSTTSTHVDIATLPAGSRPAGTHLYTQMSGLTVGVVRVDVLTSGVIRLQLAVSTTVPYLSLEGISFRLV